MTPDAPTAQTSDGPVPPTPENVWPVPLDCVDQLAPLKCTMVPIPPTAKTFAADVPHTAISGCVVGDGFAQKLPLKNRIWPPSATIHTCEASEPHTPWMLPVTWNGNAIGDHVEPL